MVNTYEYISHNLFLVVLIVGSLFALFQLFRVINRKEKQRD
jgi:hypothetical protein